MCSGFNEVKTLKFYEKVEANLPNNYAIDTYHFCIPYDPYFTLGPMTVTILSGNEEDRFEIKPNVSSTYDSVNDVITPSPHEYTTELLGETITLCTNSKFIVCQKCCFQEWFDDFCDFE